MFCNLFFLINQNSFKSSCKFGFAGNVEPQITIPSYLAASESKASLPGTFELNGLEDLTSHIGLDVKSMKHLNPVPFMEHGIISNFDLFTAFMNQVPYTVLSYDTRRTPLLIVIYFFKFVLSLFVFFINAYFY